MFGYWLLPVLFLATAYGKDVVVDLRNCTHSEAIKAVTCLNQLDNFAAQKNQLDFEDSQEVKEFKKSCDSLQSCFAAATCKSFADEHKSVVQDVKKICNVIEYMTGDFQPCAKKLEAAKSACFAKWDPNAVEATLKENETPACEKFYGENGCIKKEIAEKCSEKEWNGFRDFVIKSRKCTE